MSLGSFVMDCVGDGQLAANRGAHLTLNFLANTIAYDFDAEYGACVPRRAQCTQARW